jgi:hypothetical protein fuD12_02524
MKIKTDVVQIEILKNNEKYSTWWITEINNKIINESFYDKNIGVKSENVAHFSQYIDNDIEKGKWLDLPNGKFKGDYCDIPNTIKNDEVDALKEKIKLVNEKYGVLKTWRAKKGEIYFCIVGIQILELIDDYENRDNKNYILENYFRTKEEAENILKDKENYDYYFWQFLKNNKTNILFTELDKLEKENLN